MTTLVQKEALNDRILPAAFYALSAHFLFVVMGATAKYLSETHHVIEVAFFRNLFVVIPFFIILAFSGRLDLLKTKRPKTVAVRAIVGSLSLIVTFGAQSLLPLSNATVLLYMSTLLTPAFAYFFLRERVGAHRWAAIIIGMSGVLVIAAPSSKISAIGLVLALFAAFLHASMYTMLRHLKTEPAVTVTFYFVLAGMIVPGLLMPWYGQGIRMEEAWLFFLVGASGGFAQLALTNAYKYAPAAVITPFAYTSLIWSTLMDSMIWHNPPGHSVYTGAAIIIAAQLYILYREHVNRQKTSHIKSEIP
ncbi:MAG: DMT family transporter [Alphaproteobacteria bacterium]|nr:DMT family transporter [Alphaproteobacteria bacterium]